jgi:hypothetical protein
MVGASRSSSSIYRFDGAVFKNYGRKDKKVAPLIREPSIHLKETAAQYLIGTEEGMSRYDIKADTLQFRR